MMVAAKAFTLVSEIVNYLILVVSGGLLYKWLYPFIPKRKILIVSAVAYITITYAVSYALDRPAASYFKYLSLMVPLLIIGIADRRNYRQKIFLMALFILLRWLSIGLFIELNWYETELVSGIGWIMNHIPVLVAEFYIWRLLWGAGIIFTMYFAIVNIQKVYLTKSEDLTWQEFIMLMAPTIAMLLEKPMMAQYLDLWNEGLLNGTIQKNMPGNPYRLFFYILAYTGTVSLVYFYQQIKNRQKEDAEHRALEQQIEENRRSICRILDIYRDMSALKHDMGNHIAVMEHAIQNGQLHEAESYTRSLKDKLEEIKPEIATGNPITDIILSDHAKSCREKGIIFAADFHFPRESKIDVFDLSVILTNALQNAEEAEERTAVPEIKISSFQKEGMYLILVQNVIEKTVLIADGSGLPATDKTEKGHGYGLKNIKNVALKYGGDLDIRQECDSDGRQWFLLDVMLQI